MLIEPTEDFVQRIIKFRATHKLSMVSFAKMCGVSKSAIWNLENGRRRITETTKALIESAMEDK